MRFSLFGIVILLLFLTSLAFSLFFAGCGQPPPEQETAITIAAVGDIMMGTTYPQVCLPPDDGRHLFTEVSPLLKKADLAFGNLEGPLLDNGSCRKDTSRKYTYAFRTPARFSRNLARAGFDVLSLANNHSRDFGESGLLTTKNLLRMWGMVGISEGEPAFFLVRNVKVGVVAFSSSPSPLSLARPEAALKLIEKLSAQCQILVVSFHCGSEGPGALHLPQEEEFFCGENRGFALKIGRQAVQHGADLVLMHGPHVPRAVEVYQDRLIAYSLGNFCTYGFSSLKGPMALAPLLVVKVDSSGRLQKAAVVSFQQVAPGGPVPDRFNRALTL
ncbi:MAG TPA: CapA family protein, partial [bacterium]|nr:CapA family protein [bacterium]